MSFIYNSTIKYENIKYNKDYIYLTLEGYNKYPDIEREVKSIHNYYTDKSIPLFFLLDGIRIYAKSIRMSNITGKLRYTDGDIGLLYYQMKHYSQLIHYYDKKKKVNNICEIGFQFGVGAITLITAVKHKVNYFGFDYGYKHSKDSYNIISKFFSMKMMWGDSQRTIPFFYRTNHTFDKCDIIHIDGCHSQYAIYNDILHMKKISLPKSLLLLDDVFRDSESILKAEMKNIITNVKCYSKPYCVASYM